MGSWGAEAVGSTVSKNLLTFGGGDMEGKTA